MAKINIIHGNIFETKCQTIVNPVNCYGVMGKGLALEFKLRYPKMYQSYKSMCDDKLLTIGTLQLWKNNTPWILNFPTKNHWKRPSKIEYIEKGLSKFKDSYKKKNIKSIAFPQLGTQAGGLSWGEVKPLMYKHLEPLTGIEIEIYHFTRKSDDSLYEKFKLIVDSYNVNDFKEKLNIPKQNSQIIIDALSNNSIDSMFDLQQLSGLGRTTLVKIYDFLNEDKTNEVTLNQIDLF